MRNPFEEPKLAASWLIEHFEMRERIDYLTSVARRRAILLYEEKKRLDRKDVYDDQIRAARSVSAGQIRTLARVTAELKLKSPSDDDGEVNLLLDQCSSLSERYEQLFSFAEEMRWIGYDEMSEGGLDGLCLETLTRLWQEAVESIKVLIGPLPEDICRCLCCVAKDVFDKNPKYPINPLRLLVCKAALILDRGTPVSPFHKLKRDHRYV